MSLQDWVGVSSYALRRPIVAGNLDCYGADLVFRMAAVSGPVLTTVLTLETFAFYAYCWHAMARH